MTSFKKLQPEEYLSQHYDQGSRPDGRKGLSSLRPVSISVGSISTADGSAVVKQGDTIVVCGVKLEIAQPKAESPRDGFVVPNLTLSPLCHPQFRPGPPTDLAQVSSQFIYETILNSGLLKVQDLCLLEGKYVWSIYVDLSCLNFAGNILDVCIKALVAALQNVQVPAVKIVQNEDNDEVGIQVDLTGQKSRLKLGPIPTSCTLGAFGQEKLLLDPTDEEEEFSDAVVTVVLNGETNELCHVHKPGGSGISPEMLQQCINMAKKNSKAIQKLISSASAAALKN